jgi:hypothetical protein
MLIYNYTLQGHEATLENAQNAARGLDWQEIEKTKNDSLPYLRFIETINGIEIWECYGTASYLFTDVEDDNSLLKLHKEL